MWALEELGLPYDLVVMPFPPRFEYKGYLDINPLGTVPTFIDGDVVMTESTGICQYLVEKYSPNELGLDEKEPEERRNPGVAQDYAIWFHSRLRSVEAALEGKEFLVGGRFTIADIAVGYALQFGDRLGLSDRYKANCKRYLASLYERPAYKSLLQKSDVPE